MEERERYVRWWINCSGLTKDELRRLATGMWSDRFPEQGGENASQRAA